MILHHGDCVGADDQVNRLVRTTGRWWTIAHPCTITAKRAYSPSDEIRDPKPPLERNSDLAQECKWLVAFPSQDHETLRSGTWSTIRRARAFGRHITIVFPDGRVEEENIEETEE